MTAVMRINIGKALLLCFVGFSAVLLFILSPEMQSGVKQGLQLCAKAVLPSLFLFTALSLFTVYTDCASLFGRTLYPVFGKLLCLEPADCSCWFMSYFSGYPVGAKMISALYSSGKITRAKGLKMLTFCVNSGPSFIIIAVGECVLGSKSDGIRLLACHILSSLTIALAVSHLPNRLFANNESTPPFHTQKKERRNLHVSDAFVFSVSDAASTMITVCAFVVLFSAVGNMLSALPLPHRLADVLTGLCEVTVGVQGCTRSTLLKAAFYLGLGGISVIFQVLSTAKNLSPMLWLVAVSQTVRGILSALFIYIAELIWPRSLTTISMGQSIKSATVTTSPVAATALILLSVVLICFVDSKRKNRPVDR